MTMLHSKYEHVPFDQIFTRVKRPLLLEDAVEYSCLGARLYGLGAYVREQKLGATISRKQQWLVKEGDVLYNKLFAWKGTFAVAGDSVDGCIASDKFPTYSYDTSRVDPSYLQLWFMGPWIAAQAEEYSKGAAALSKLTLNPPDFWKLTIPLPSLEEQRHIAAKATAMLQLIEEVQDRRKPLDAVIHGRRAGVGSQVRLLLDFALDEMTARYQSDMGILDSVLTMRPRSGPSFPVSEEGRGMPVIMPSATLGYRYDPTKVLYGFGNELIKDADILEQGDLLITRGNYRDQVGICVVYDGRSKERTYANLIMRAKVNHETVLPEFVKYWIMSPLCVRYVRQHTKGTSPSVQKINQRALIAMPFPKQISLRDQRQWVDRLDKLFNEVEQIEQLIRQQYEEVCQYKDIVLNAAFSGALFEKVSNQPLKEGASVTFA